MARYRLVAVWLLSFGWFWFGFILFGLSFSLLMVFALFFWAVDL